VTAQAALCATLVAGPWPKKAQSLQTNADIPVKDRTLAAKFLARVAPDLTLTCLICGDAMCPPVFVSVENTQGHWRKHGCEHTFCDGCLAQWVATRVGEQSTHICCPHESCKYVLYNDDVKRLAANSQVAAAFEQLLIVRARSVGWLVD
jgi:hypothetical protein